jgi:transposase
MRTHSSSLAAISLDSAHLGEIAPLAPGCRLRAVDESAGDRAIISSAMAAAIGAGDGFAKGRNVAAWLGLVLNQFSTGARTILGKISKHGNRHLWVLFVQAAWVGLNDLAGWRAASAVLVASQSRPWARTLQAMRASLLASAIATRALCCHERTARRERARLRREPEPLLKLMTRG